MELWLKTNIAAATDITEIIVHIVKKTTDMDIIAGTRTTVIGITVARGKRIDRMVMENVYNPERGT